MYVRKFFALDRTSPDLTYPYTYLPTPQIELSQRLSRTMFLGERSLRCRKFKLGDLRVVVGTKRHLLASTEEHE